MSLACGATLLAASTKGGARLRYAQATHATALVQLHTGVGLGNSMGGLYHAFRRGKPRNLVFVSYSHKDADWRDRLSTFLKPYTKQGRLNVWADPYIQVGDEWRRNISAALAEPASALVGWPKLP